MYSDEQTITREEVFRTSQHVQAIRAKLEDIHTWYEQNLKLPRNSSGTSRHNRGLSTASETFAVLEEQGSEHGGEARVLVCPHARFEDLWKDQSEARNDIPTENILRCECSTRTGCHNMQYTRKPQAPWRLLMIMLMVL